MSIQVVEIPLAYGVPPYIFRHMKKFLLSLIAIAALAIGANAKTYNLPEEDTEASVAIPASWTVEAEDETLTALSKDETIEISVELLDADQLEGAIEEAMGYLKKNKVKVDDKSEKKTTGDIGGLTTTCYSMMGKDEDGVCNISLIFVRLSKDRFVQILYWAPEEVEKTQMDEISAILGSIKKK